jgi:hypothetical protein
MRRIVMSSALALCCVGLVTPRLNAQSTQQVQPPAGFPAIGAPPTVTVISNGAEPRKALRYVSAKGHREHLTVDFLMALNISVGDTSLPEVKAPMLRGDVDVEVTDVNATGDMTLSTIFTDANWIGASDSDPSMMARLNSVTSDLKGISGVTVVSSRGITRDVKLDTSKITNPQLSQTLAGLQQVMQNVSQPLPEEPVGVGATWEVRSGANANGVQMFNTVSLQLTAMDDTSYTLKVALEQTAPPQTVSTPAMGGATASLDSSTGTGTGTAKVQFDKLTPTSQMNMNTKTTMSIDMGGNVQHMNMAMSMKVAVTPGVVKPPQNPAPPRPPDSTLPLPARAR